MRKEKLIKIQSGLTHEQIEEIHNAVKYPIVYDEDAPKLSHELIERYKRHDPDVFVR